MKILLDCSRISTGGAIQNSLAVLHNARVVREHEWHVIMTARLSRELSAANDSDFASVRRLDDWGPRRTRFAQPLAMPRWERAIAPDVCFAPGGPVYWRARSRQIVAFAVPHLIYPESASVYFGLKRQERWRRRLLLSAARRSFFQADDLIVQTETVRDRLHRVLGYPRERIYLAKNSYSPVFAEAARRAQRRPDHDRFVVLVPSAYYAHKNLECVPDVLNEAHRQGMKDIEFRLTLPEASAGWRFIHARAASLGVASMLRTLGDVPHETLAAEYRDADLVFLPTLLECSTAVYPEAFETGVAVVTSDLDFARELCGDAAHYVDPHAPASMAEAIVQLARDDNARQRLVNAGRLALTTRYSSPEEKWRAQLACITLKTIK